MGLLPSDGAVSEENLTLSESHISFLCFCSQISTSSCPFTASPQQDPCSPRAEQDDPMDFQKSSIFSAFSNLVTCRPSLARANLDIPDVPGLILRKTQPSADFAQNFCLFELSSFPGGVPRVQTKPGRPSQSLLGQQKEAAGCRAALPVLRAQAWKNNHPQW